MKSELEKIPEIEESSLIVYARLWQLECWLREMVYVELKAKKGKNWINFNKTKTTYESDQELTHIPGKDHNPLSFKTFNELIKVIENNWDLFSFYLPPKHIWAVKVEEIILIRNRCAHFRRGHSDDLSRLTQLLRDIDKGFWHFCTQYNDFKPIIPPESDPVSAEFLAFDPFSFKEIEENTWARIGSAEPNLPFIVTIGYLKRHWASNTTSIDGKAGYIYDISFSIRNRKQIDIEKFLQQTVQYKSEIIHFCLDSFATSIRFTIPAVVGSDRVIEIVTNLINVLENSLTLLRETNLEDAVVQKIADQWPENVIGPKNPLTFLSPDMPCSFFNVQKNS
ncbi:Swt1 family HEPN domain-containing protein [Vibrio vulnificus]|uniref:Swt1 family HEPN domain-containing protein n=1 Tax=Vibrio vulnificus TaxID=672 RepID=UPI003EDAED3E